MARRRAVEHRSGRLDDLVGARRPARPPASTSVCSAHPLVLEAAVVHARETGAALLIEATSNQVDQDGGYTGMRPARLPRAGARHRGAAPGSRAERMILGGDHLGPNRWRALPPRQAMERAEELVGAYVEAGFTKLHLDCTFVCADDAAPLERRDRGGAGGAADGGGRARGRAAGRRSCAT